MNVRDPVASGSIPSPKLVIRFAVPPGFEELVKSTLTVAVPLLMSTTLTTAVASTWSALINSSILTVKLSPSTKPVQA